MRHAIVIIAALCACGSSTEPQQPLPLALFEYDRTAALNLVTSAPEPFGSGTISSISYTSPGGGTVTGRLAVPAGSGPFAGMVLMHGLPGTAQGAMNGEGLALMSRGAVVIAIDAPWARRGGLPEFTPRDSAEQVQLMHDLQRAVDVLLARSDVDPARIGYTGISYGAAMGGLFVGIERRLGAYALVVGDGGLVAHFTAADGSPLGPLASQSAEGRNRWLEAMRPIEPIRFVHRAPPAAGLLQNGRTDQLVTVEDAEALHAAARAPVTVRWYDAGHGLNAVARSERYAWFAGRIGTAP